jgi:hypothetical protein
VKRRKPEPACGPSTWPNLEAKAKIDGIIRRQLKRFERDGKIRARDREAELERAAIQDET